MVVGVSVRSRMLYYYGLYGEVPAKISWSVCDASAEMCDGIPDSGSYHFVMKRRTEANNYL